MDLGTANTLIYVKGEGIVLNEPSVVAMDRSSSQPKAYGLDAKRMLGRTPEGIIKRCGQLKDGVIADFEVTERMLRHFLKTIIDKHVFRGAQGDRLRAERDHRGASRGARLGRRRRAPRKCGWWRSRWRRRSASVCRWRRRPATW
ncbi:MAG: rod shape-determining protein [Gemmatimonadales bacterium]